MKLDSYVAPAGRSIKQFAKEAGICVATIYNLTPAYRPMSTRIGNRVVVLEAPADWLSRVASMGGAVTRRWPRKAIRRRQALPEASPPDQQKHSRSRARG